MISILLPVRNEGDRLAACLERVFAQHGVDLPYEVIVEDGKSTDGTRTLVQQLQQAHPNLKLIDNPGRIVPTGLNAAIRQARGEIIVRVDGHTLIAPDYVRQCVETLQRTGADNVGGCMTARGEGRFAEAISLATSTPFGIGDSQFHYSRTEQEVDSVYMGAWRKDAFEKFGLFDEELVRDQDDEFNYRLRKHGGRVVLNPTIRSRYTVRSTPRALWRQYYQYGYWKVRVLQKHPRQMSLRQFVPPAFVLGLLGSLVLAFIPPFRFLATLIPGLYLLVNLVASLVTAARKGSKFLPLLPATFAILHLSYGLGFLAGLVKFWNRWADKTGKVPQFTHETAS